jgi:hypothetical protein
MGGVLSDIVWMLVGAALTGIVIAVGIWWDNRRAKEASRRAFGIGDGSEERGLCASRPSRTGRPPLPRRRRMKIWLLKPAVSGNDPSTNPWEPWYDCVFGMVVRAETEAEARQFAAEQAGAEKGSRTVSGRDAQGNRTSTTYERENPWLDSTLSRCEELTPDGKPGVVIRDSHNA